MYDRIVIAVDGSGEAAHAARRGFDLADAFDAAVDIIHVVERSALRLTRTSDERTRLRDRGVAILNEIEGAASEVGLSVSTELVDGRPAVQISEFAAAADADLVVVGRQGLTGVRRRLVGGVTERILRQSPVPVLVVPDGGPAAETAAGYSRILLPTDGSEPAADAVPHAEAVGRAYGSTVHALNVVDLQTAGGVFNAGGLDSEFVERLEARGREAVDRVADEIGDAALEIEVRTVVERSTSFDGVAAGIRGYVENNGIDLVVMSSHGRSNLTRQLLGSVAATVLRTVGVPVLVVKRSG